MSRPLLADGQLKQTIALPTGASAVTSPAIDTATTVNGDQVAEFEVLVSAPAVTVGMLSNTNTIVYDLIQSVNADLSSPTTLIAGLLTQTGAGGAGAGAATKRAGIPTDSSRYLGLKATKSVAGDASSVSATIQLLF